MALSWSELERAAEAVLDGYPTASRLTQLVEYALGEQLPHIVDAGSPLRKQVFELLRWARRQHRLEPLLRRALDDNPRNHDLATVIPALLARLAGVPSPGERLELPVLDQPTLDQLGGRRGLMLIAAREHAELLADVEDALRTLGDTAAPTVVARRYIDPDQASFPPHPNLDVVQVAIMFVGRDLTTSSYLWSPEAAELLDRHYARRIRLIPIQLGGLIHAASKLAGLSMIDGRSADTLAAQIADTMAADIARAAGARSLDDYVDELDQRLAGRDGDVDGFIEPTKLIVTPAQDRRLARRATRTTDMQLPAILAAHGQHRAVVVLGEPGAGKSLLLRRLARHHLARLSQGEHRALVPIYLNLATYTDRDGDRPASILGFLRRSLATGPARQRYVARELDVLLAERRLLLLLDGMDEMPRADFAARTAQLRELIHRHHCRIVLACRERDFHATMLPVLEIRLRPFSNRQIAAHLMLVAGISRTTARHETQMLTAAVHPLAHVVRNPLSLGLIAHQRAIDGSYPAVVGELFHGFTTRALRAERTEVDPAALRDDLATIAFEMATLANPGTAVSLAELMVALADKTRLPVPKAIDGAVASGLVRRDDSTGALLFSHTRVQERFMAAHLVRLDAAPRRVWLEAHAGDIGFEEIYVMAAREGLDCRDLIASIERDAVQFLNETIQPSLARDVTLEEHERRLILLGRIAESAALDAIVVRPVAELLIRLSSMAVQFTSVGRIRLAVLQAARANMLAHPGLRDIVMHAASSRYAAERREAWRALASAGRLSTVRRLVVRQAASTNYLRHVRDDQRLARIDPRLSSLARWSSLTLVLHVLLVAITIRYIASGFDAPINTKFCAILLLSAFVIDTSRAQDGVASTLNVIARGFLAGVSAGVAVVLPELAARTLQTIGGDAATPLASLARLDQLPLSCALGATIGCVGTVLFGRVRQTMDDRWLPILAGGMIGALISASYGLEAHSPAWAGDAALACAGAVVVAWIHAERPNWRREQRRPRTATRRAAPTNRTVLVMAVAFILGLGLAVLGAVLPGLARGSRDVMQAGGTFMIVVVVVLGALWLLYRNLRAGTTLIARAPCGLAEAREHLLSLTSGTLVDTARAQLVHRLQSVTPLSRVLELALTDLTSESQWQRDSELAVTLRELSRRRAYTDPGERATIDDELRMLTAVTRLDGAAILSLWLSELALEQREVTLYKAFQVLPEMRDQLAKSPAEPS